MCQAKSQTVLSQTIFAPSMKSQALRELNTIAQEAMNEIQTKIKEEDLMKPSASTVCLVVGDPLICMVVAVAFAYCRPSSSLWLVGLVWGLAQSRFGYCMHAAIHNAVFPSYKMNRALGIFSMNIVIGISWRWWRHRHNQHHQHCNVSTEDPDLKTSPLIVYDEKLASGELTVFQRALLPVYLSLYIAIWRIFSVLKCMKNGWYADIGWTSLHWVAVLSFFTYLSAYTWVETIFVLAIAEAVSGWCMGLTFMMSHVLESVVDSATARDMNLMLHTISTTRNTHLVSRGNNVGNAILLYVTGGLCYQIEHHLFPNIPNDKLPRVAAYVEQALRKRGLVYVDEPLIETYVAIWHKLADMEHLAALRLSQKQ